MSRKKKILFTIVLVIIFLIFLELATELSLYHFNALGNYEKEYGMEVYKLMPQRDQYFKDAVECAKQRTANHTTSYSRYVLFTELDDCETATVTYTNHVRKTWNPDAGAASSGKKVVTVGMFGGSTMEGLGAVDDETIPSNFSKLANTSGDGRIYEATNYGESSYTFTQSVLKLLLLLRDGKRFDYVVFYNGTNDIDNSYEAGDAGALYNEVGIKTALQGTMWQKIDDFIKWRVLNGCALCKTAVIISRNTPFLRDKLTPILVRMRDFIYFKKGESKSEADMAPFAGQIAEYYKKSHDMLDALSNAYGFKYLEFWQPSLMYGNDATPGEKLIYNIDPRLTDPKLVALYRETLDDVNSYHLKNFEDLSGALKGRPHAYYMDAVHISGEANGVIAKKIYDAFLGAP